jgi:hypothetical protein
MAAGPLQDVSLPPILDDGGRPGNAAASGGVP